MYKYPIYFCFAFFLSTGFVFASIPERTTQESLLDITVIENPEEEHFFYGDFNSFPHTFQINAEEDFSLYVEIRTPNIANVEKNVSGIIVRERDRGGVVEIERLPFADGIWNEVRNKVDGNTYLVGPSFEENVGPGVYRIEVSTPDNTEKYVLVVGKSESTEDISFFGKVKRIAEVKAFFGKSKLMAVQSPIVYVPLLFIVLLCCGGYVVWRRMSRTLV